MAPPRVGVSIGVTLNVGNYETVRAEALFHRDVELEVETIEEAYDDCVREAKAGLEAALEGVRKTYKDVHAAPFRSKDYAAAPQRPKR